MSMKKGKGKEKLDGSNQYSEPVHEIIGRPPCWLMRCGITVIVAVVVLLIFGGYFISYPDLIKGNIIIAQQGQSSQIIFPRNGAGKIKEGQKINVKFDEYPFLEFGIIQLHVPQSEMIPITDPLLGMSYTMEIQLSDTLKTQYGYRIPCRPGMTGVAEVITDDLTVLDRMLNPIRMVLKR